MNAKQTPKAGACSWLSARLEAGAAAGGATRPCRDPGGQRRLCSPPGTPPRWVSPGCPRRTAPGSTLGCSGRLCTATAMQSTGAQPKPCAPPPSRAEPPPAVLSPPGTLSAACCGWERGQRSQVPVHPVPCRCRAPSPAFSPPGAGSGSSPQSCHLCSRGRGHRVQPGSVRFGPNKGWPRRTPSRRPLSPVPAGPPRVRTKARARKGGPRS